MAERTNGYTPIWSYTASGINWIYKSKIWEESKGMPKDWFHVPEGIKIVLINSMASVIEGCIKTYLKAKIENSLSNKILFERMLNEEEEENMMDSELIAEIDIDESIIFFQQEPIEERIRKNDNFLKKVLNININNSKKSKFSIPYFFNLIKTKISPNLNFESREAEKINEILNLIEKCHWESLNKKWFKKVNGQSLKNVLDDIDTNLYDDVLALFKFRNFFAHSNNIKLEFSIETENTNVDFKGKAEYLQKYLKRKKLNIPEEEGVRFIQILVPDGLVHHFKICLDKFFKSEILKEYFETSNLVNLIWKRQG